MISVRRSLRSTTRSDERGAAAIVVAVTTCFVLFVVAALTVDIGNTWARRGSLQSQVDHAAKLAAEKLPVDSTTVGSTPTPSQLKVAKAAAYYMACHVVPGQKELSAIPACPSASAYPTDPALDGFARAMLANAKSATPSRIGGVSFPAVNKVKLTAPAAKIEFGFGKVAGKDQSIQSKSATAVVLSPGTVLPVGMSATCIANAVGAVAALGVGDSISKVLPINYLTTGQPNSVGGPAVTPLPYTPGDTDWSDVTGLYNNHPATIDVNVALSSIAPNGAVTVALNWKSGKAGFTIETIRIYIRKSRYVVGDPTGFYVVDVSIPLLQQGNTSGTQQVSLNLPAGDYEGMVRLSGRNTGLGSLQNWINNANQNAEFQVPETGLSRTSCPAPDRRRALALASAAPSATPTPWP